MLYDGDTFTHDGLTFTFKTERDEDTGEPWKAHDGHGEVSEWTTREKAAGEMVLSVGAWGRADKRRYYDFAGTCKKALAEGWGLPEESPPVRRTKRQIAAKAAMLDFQRLKDWCEDKWEWVGVIVTCTDLPGNPSASLWGIESDAGEYLEQVARELADQIIEEEAAKVALAVTPAKAVA